MHPKRKLIESYIFQIDKPFSVTEVSNVTGVASSTVSENVHKMLNEGRITLIKGSRSPQLYRYVRPTKYKQETKSNLLKFTPDLDKLKEIYDLIEKYPRVYDICEVVPYSESTVRRYVKVLMYDSCIVKNNGKYLQYKFEPSGKTFDQYPVIQKHFKRPELISELKQICFRVNKDMPDVSGLKNHEITDLIESFYVIATIQIITKGEL